MESVCPFSGFHFVKTEPNIGKIGFKLTVKPEVDLKALLLPSAGITGVHHHIWFYVELWIEPKTWGILVKNSPN